MMPGNRRRRKVLIPATLYALADKAQTKELFSSRLSVDKRFFCGPDGVQKKKQRRNAHA